MEMSVTVPFVRNNFYSGEKTVRFLTIFILRTIFFSFPNFPNFSFLQPIKNNLFYAISYSQVTRRKQHPQVYDTVAE